MGAEGARARRAADPRRSALYPHLRDGRHLGGIINYIIEHDRWFRDYVLHYTNASTIISDDYADSEQLGGLFSGLDPSSRRYEASTGDWGYQRSKSQSPRADGNRAIATDPTLEHPRCVFQILKRHFERYTPSIVARVCGCKPEEFLRVAELMCRNSGPERTGAIVYALGWTQHSTGVQMIRSAAIIQLLLGNVGRPGGGVMAMRGHCSIQGSTDIPTLYDLLPGYIPQPLAVAAHASLASYLEYGQGYAAAHRNSAAGFWREAASMGYWANLPKFMTSLLKAWYGDAATADNDYCYGYIPKVDGDYSQLATFFAMYQGAG